MSRTQRSISIKNEILSKLHFNEMEMNPICPIGKSYRTKTNKVSKKHPITIQEEIASVKSIKLVKPYQTEKTIKIEPADYTLSTILKSNAYKKLQTKYLEMTTNFNYLKKKLCKDIKKLDRQISEETQNASKLCDKLMELDNTFERLENQYYEIKRNNYNLRIQVQHQRSPDLQRLWDATFHPPSVQGIDLDRMSYEQILEMEERLGKQNVGMKAEVIQKIPVSTFKEIRQNKSSKLIQDKDRTNCCICCENIEDQDKIILLECQHVHHATCIKQWLKIKKFCPLCKKQVNVNNQ